MIGQTEDNLLLKKPRAKAGLYFFDKNLAKDDKSISLIGVDEAGRGPLAGPVVACAAYIPETATQHLYEVNDSKKLSHLKRVTLFRKMILAGVRFGFGYSLPEEIDRINILNATFKAMRKAVFNLIKYLKVPESSVLVLVDGPHKIKELPLNQKTIIDGDAKSLSIACASIFAKVIRDNWMNILDFKYPQYGFSKHKGYGTALHIERIKEYGLSDVHRKSFKLSKKYAFSR